MTEAKLGLSNKIVKMERYNSLWKLEFMAEKEILKGILKNFTVYIEHVGSTAVKDLKSKPIIDIAIGVISYPDMYEVKTILVEHGYYYNEKAGDIDRIFIAKGAEDCRKFNIHIEIYEGESWNNHIEFRDFLREHKECSVNYERLKCDLAKKYSSDRQLYTEAKGNFIQSVLKEVRSDKSDSDMHKSI